ncbi:DUF362 domain-containing protein [Desulforhopalus sp. 52FAK]
MEFTSVDFVSFKQSITEALDNISAHESIAGQNAILIKPNLINNSPHPITTSPECCEAVLEYVLHHSTAKVVIAEGCGAANMETQEVFETLGYTDLAEKYNIDLIDLNHEPVQRVSDERGTFLKEIYLPEIAFTHYIISVPVLKAHSLARVTGTIKNMMGFVPPSHYSGSYGSWKKAAFHQNMQQSLIDLSLHISPDVSIMDCSIGMAEYHLGGPHCNPPVGKIIAGYNPWTVDQKACDFLGLNWAEIEHVAAGIRQEPVTI